MSCHPHRAHLSSWHQLDFRPYPPESSSFTVRPFGHHCLCALYRSTKVSLHNQFLLSLWVPLPLVVLCQSLAGGATICGRVRHSSSCFKRATSRCYPPILTLFGIYSFSLCCRTFCKNQLFSFDLESCMLVHVHDNLFLSNYVCHQKCFCILSLYLACLLQFINPKQLAPFALQNEPG